jgi:hypothetical protein
MALALAACSPPSGTPDPPSTTPAKASIAGLGEAPSPPPSSESPHVVTAANFLSPSGNIGCYLDTQSARCDIAKKSWTPPPAPADCELDWAFGVSVDNAEKAAFTCAGDTVLGAKDKLEYGESLQAGGFMCRSDRKAMRCENVTSGHGFTLSAERYHLF